MTSTPHGGAGGYSDTDAGGSGGGFGVAGGKGSGQLSGSRDGGGGGGGGANAAGGAGGDGGGGNPEPGGSAGNAGAAGSNGGPGGTSGDDISYGGGGGGGGGGGTSLTLTSSQTVGSNQTGGNGGMGGHPADGGGGGGGAGGDGVDASGAVTVTVVSGVKVTAGQGGDGGQGGIFSLGGDGGDGGIGVNGAQVLINAGTISGGAGGSKGASGGVGGAAGAGGTGVVGSGMTIVNSGTIKGGVSGDATQVQADAVDFTGGTNSFTITSTSILVGNVVAFSTADTFGLGGNTNGTFDLSQLGDKGSGTAYQGFGTLDKSGTSTWTLSGTPGTTNALAYRIEGGTLEDASASGLGTGTITFAPASGSVTNLLLDAVAQPSNGGAFANTLDSFGVGDTLDLAGLAYAPGATATVSGGVLTVMSGGTTENFNVTNPGNGSFAALDDGSGGLLVGTATNGLVSYTPDATFNPASNTGVPLVVYGGAGVSYTVTAGTAMNGDETLTVSNGVAQQVVDLGTSLAALNLDFSSNTAPVSLTGGAGNDIISGGSGNDTLNGGNGNDIISGGTGTNTITGGDGTDTVTYENYQSNTNGVSGVNVNLQTRTATDAYSQLPLFPSTFRDTLNGIENVCGSASADFIFGGAGRNVMEGGGSNDTITAGSGDGGSDATDFASYLHSAAGVTVSLVAGATNTGGDAEGDVLNGIQNLYGSTHDDTLTGNGSANTIRGFGGADTISTGAGNDRVFISSTPTLVDGGDDFDVLNIVVEGASTPSVVLTDTNFQNFERVNVYDGARVDMSGVSQGLLIRSASTAGRGANIYGTGGRDRILGGDGQDVLRGGAGNDVIKAGEANQTIEGGTGNDLIYASTGTGANNPQDTFNMMLSGFGRDTIRGTADALSNDIFQVSGLGSQLSDLSFAKYGNGAIVTGTGGQPGDGVFFSGLTVDQAKGLNFRFDAPAST